jgi:hypothetical protein
MRVVILCCTEGHSALFSLLLSIAAGFVLVQVGEVKKGLKTLKATGLTEEDYLRHIMFVQV